MIEGAENTDDAATHIRTGTAGSHRGQGWRVPIRGEALDAAVAAVENAAAPGFDGRTAEPEELLMEGLSSGDPIPSTIRF
jgi:hypothetical protein